MKKAFFIALVSLVSSFFISATTLEAKPVDSHNCNSSVSINFAGISEGFELETKTLVAMYNLMPQKIKNLCISSYKDIAPMLESSKGKTISYQGVRITSITTQNGIDLKFSHNGHSLVLKNYTRAEFDEIFGL